MHEVLGWKKGCPKDRAEEWIRSQVTFSWRDSNVNLSDNAKISLGR